MRFEEKEDRAYLSLISQTFILNTEVCKDSHYRLEDDNTPVTLLIIILEAVADIREEKEISIKTRNETLKEEKDNMKSITIPLERQDVSNKTTKSRNLASTVTRSQ